MYNIQFETNFVFNVLRDCRIKNLASPYYYWITEATPVTFAKRCIMYHVSCQTDRKTGHV